MRQSKGNQNSFQAYSVLATIEYEVHTPRRSFTINQPSIYNNFVINRWWQQNRHETFMLLQYHSNFLDPITVEEHEPFTCLLGVGLTRRMSGEFLLMAG